MTTDPRRALAALALVPVAAGAFAGAVAWVADRPAATAADQPQADLSVGTVAAADLTGLDPREAAVAAEIEALQTRLVDLQGELAARAAQPASPAAVHRTAPAPRPAPPVDTTTRASG